VPTIYLPTFNHADSQKGFSKTEHYAGMQGKLILGCIELAVLSDKQSNPLTDLSAYDMKGLLNPEAAVRTANRVAKKIIKRFDIRNYKDYLSVRPTLEQLYSHVAIFDDNETEYVRFQNRWYTREWNEYQHKNPKGEFGVLLNLGNTEGETGIAVAVDGAEFKPLKHGVALIRTTYATVRDKGPSIKAYKEQARWMKLREQYSLIDLWKRRNRSEVVNLTALEALATSQTFMVMQPATREQATFFHDSGFAELVGILELAAMQTRHNDLEKRVFVRYADVVGLKERCETSNVNAEIAAMLTAFYRPDLVKTTKKKTVKSK
jgi:hypothetical protein